MARIVGARILCLLGKIGDCGNDLYRDVRDFTQPFRVQNN